MSNPPNSSVNDIADIIKQFGEQNKALREEARNNREGEMERDIAAQMAAAEEIRKKAAEERFKGSIAQGASQIAGGVFEVISGSGAAAVGKPRQGIPKPPAEKPPVDKLPIRTLPIEKAPGKQLPEDIDTRADLKKPALP